MAKALKGHKEHHIPIINRLKNKHSVSLVGSAEFGSVTAFRHNRVKWATRAEPDTNIDYIETCNNDNIGMKSAYLYL